MSMDGLTTALKTVRRTVFRLETLSRYTAPGEADLLRAFRAGDPLPPRTPETDPWLRMVRDSVAAGRAWTRVHVLSRPLSEYLQFEILGYQGNVAAGEDVRIGDLDTHPALATLTTDFWLLDDQTAYVMHYDDDGRRVGMNRTDDVATLIQHRELAIAHSVPLAEYLPSVRHELRRTW